MTISDEGLQNSSAKWVPEGSVLIAMYGATIGKLGITAYPLTTNQAIAFVETGEGIEPRYLFEQLRFQKPALIRLGQGGAQPNISQEILKAQKIALPPTEEQRRIVAKLDALTARIARARAELDRVPMPTSAGLQPSSNSAKGSSDRPSNIGACSTASSPLNINHKTRATLR